jgi:predicted flap endonuclease-1-like 5' DNA nuclease
MSYLLAQIFICLLIAGLIGALIGWWLRGGCRKELREMDNDWKIKYDADKAVWQGKIDAAEGHIERSVHQNNDEWDLRLRDAESKWEGKVQGLVENYNSEISNLNLERQALEDELLVARSNLKEAHLKLTSTDEKWNLKLKDVESSWEGKVQGFMSDYDSKAGNKDQELKALKDELEANRTEVKVLQQKLVDSDNEWNLKLKDSEANWEGKVQGFMSDYDSKAGNKDQELKALKDELEANRSEVKVLQQKLVDSDNEWNLKLKDSETSWEGKLQGVMSDYDSKISKADKAQEVLKSNLSSVQTEADDAREELLRADQELFTSVGNLEECYDIEEIEGIGPGYGKRFKSMGINTTCDFAESFLNNSDAAEKASKETKIDLSAIQAWASMADLIKLPGVDGQYAEIMQVVGVSSRDELTKLNAKDLHTQMTQYNVSNPIVPEVPSLELILRWIKSPDNSKIVAALGTVSETAHDMNECYEIEEIEGIGPAYGKKLKGMGINTTCDLANSCLRDNHATKKISKKMQVDFDAVRAWASMADLMRLPGVDGQYAEIMQTVGVDSRKELTQTSVNSLQSKMAEFNAKNPIVPEVPTVDMLVAWATAAKKQKH